MRVHERVSRAQPYFPIVCCFFKFFPISKFVYVSHIIEYITKFVILSTFTPSSSNSHSDKELSRGHRRFS